MQEQEVLEDEPQLRRTKSTEGFCGSLTAPWEPGGMNPEAGHGTASSWDSGIPPAPEERGVPGNPWPYSEAIRIADTVLKRPLCGRSLVPAHPLGLPTDQP